jgi:hypothetical protein
MQKFTETSADFDSRLAVAVTGAGSVSSIASGIQCPGECEHVFAARSMVTLTAAGTPNSDFAEWTGVCTGSDTVCKVFVDDAKDVAARFTSDYPLTIGKSGSGHAVVSASAGGIDCGTTCSAALGVRSSVRLTVVPAADSYLISWHRPDCPDTLTTCDIVMNGPVELNVEIALKPVVVATLVGSGRVVELGDQLMPGADPDLVKPLEKRLRARYEQILLGTRSTRVEALPEGIRVTLEKKDGTSSSEVFDRVLVAVGRVPNGRIIGCDAAGVTVNERGFIPVDRQMRTNVPGIFAIGDIVGQPMLAHKAMHEAKVAAEVAAGHKAYFDARVIPSVAYTDPEVAWTGVTEVQAKRDGLDIRKAAFPWAASGRSLSIGRDEGFTKLILDAATNRVIGGGIVGPNAGELIAEVGLAIELGADAVDIGLTIHPHPTLSETVGLTAEALEGTLTDLYMPRKG